MKKTMKLPVIAALAMLCAAVPAFAENEADHDDVVMLYTTTNQPKSGSALCDVINVHRDAAGVSPLMQSDVLMELAAERVGKLADNQGGADAAVLEAEHACETVIRGRADINTAICSMILSEQQMKPLVCDAYAQFGYACSEDQTLWVFLFTA